MFAFVVGRGRAQRDAVNLVVYPHGLFADRWRPTIENDRNFREFIASAQPKRAVLSCENLIDVNWLHGIGEFVIGFSGNIATHMNSLATQLRVSGAPILPVYRDLGL